MKLSLKVKLLPDNNQIELLKKTIITYNQARNYVSKIAFENKTTSVVRIHHLTYYDIRSKFGLASQMSVRVITDVSRSCRKDKTKQIEFKDFSSITFDDNNFSWKKDSFISIYLMNGREKIKYIVSEYQKENMELLGIGQCLLKYDGKNFYIICYYDKKENKPNIPKEYLGIDLGISKIAVDSDGKVYSDKGIKTKRNKMELLTSELQRCGSRSAKRHLKKLTGKITRFQRDVNHCISKDIIKKAQRHNLGIALEKLTNIRKKTAIKSLRKSLHRWSFFQLRFCIEYKAKLAGVTVKIVNPKYTSQRCSECGHVSKENRKSQSKFLCTKCGFTSNADKNGAINIAFVAVTNQPIVT